MIPIKVVCGLIYKDGAVFICRRKAGKAQAGYWEFPGGKVAAAETETEALQRELEEELDMKVHVGAHFKTVIHHYEHLSIELIAYTCDFVSASYQLTDHDRYAWVAPAALADWLLAPADVPIAIALQHSRDTAG